MLHVWCVSPLEIWHSSIQRKLCVIVMTSCHKTLYDYMIVMKQYC